MAVLWSRLCSPLTLWKRDPAGCGDFQPDGVRPSIIPGCQLRTRRRHLLLIGYIALLCFSRQVRNVALYLSRTKFRPLRWRNTHPYVVVDRYEDITHPQKVGPCPLTWFFVFIFMYSMVLRVSPFPSLCRSLACVKIFSVSLSYPMCPANKFWLCFILFFL